MHCKTNNGWNDWGGSTSISDVILKRFTLIHKIKYWFDINLKFVHLLHMQAFAAMSRYATEKRAMKSEILKILTKCKHDTLANAFKAMRGHASTKRYMRLTMVKVVSIWWKKRSMLIFAMWRSIAQIEREFKQKVSLHYLNACKIGPLGVHKPIIIKDCKAEYKTKPSMFFYRDAVDTTMAKA